MAARYRRFRARGWNEIDLMVKKRHYSKDHSAKPMNLYSNPNHRRFPRRAAFIIARYTVQEGTFRDIIKNIGAGGVLVSTWRKIAQGQPIELHFPVFDFEKQLRVTGQVVRSNPRGFAVAFDRPIEELICKEGHFPEIVHEGDR